MRDGEPVLTGIKTVRPLPKAVSREVSIALTQLRAAIERTLFAEAEQNRAALRQLVAERSQSARHKGRSLNTAREVHAEGSVGGRAAPACRFAFARVC